MEEIFHITQSNSKNKKDLNRKANPKTPYEGARDFTPKQEKKR
jgi:hypothetical protein